MGRHKLGIAVAALILLVLAWQWPEGEERPSGTLAANEPTGAPAESPASGAEPAPEPSFTPPPPQSAPAAEPASNAYGGPLGTRDRTGSQAVALTFDDGPDPEWTPQVLAELRARGVKAVFCLIGAYAEDYPELVADIVREGHTLCNHTWFHEQDLGTWSAEAIRANLQRTDDAIAAAAPGAEVAYFRHPGGKWTETAIAVAADLGMASLHWSVDPSDWNPESSANEIERRVLDGVEPGAVVLLHDGASNQESMFPALRRILREFERRGYTCTSL